MKDVVHCPLSIYALSFFLTIRISIVFKTAKVSARLLIFPILLIIKVQKKEIKAEIKF